MNSKTTLVVTSISPPNRILASLAGGARERDIPFILIGDVLSPKDFHLAGCSFYSLSRQKDLDFATSALVPERHYARKNIGYLLAIRDGAEIIIEADDDNLPSEGFWGNRLREQFVRQSSSAGWVNAYAYFSDARIWPRGLPLDAVGDEVIEFGHLPVRLADCPIQQGLADKDPDVDAIYRLILPLPVTFRSDRRVAFGQGSWCPFNSQNTTWWADAFPLLYLPAYCPFRMTDIWRSFVAQRIAWANNWSILFHEPTVRQERNDHNLMRDFKDEVPGYLHNRRIGEVLDRLNIQPGAESIGENLRICYEALVEIEVFDPQELSLLDAWLNDLRALGLAQREQSTISAE